MGNITKSLCSEKTLNFKIPKSSSNLKAPENLNTTNTSTPTNKSIISIQDFKTNGKLGEGNFGKVYLVEKKITKKKYALKKIKKNRLLKDDLRLKDILNEKEILKKSQHPFIVKLKFTFQDKIYLYFGMEYISGGTLIDYISPRHKLYESTILFITAQLLLSLKYLHKNLKVIYRDLKPENILIDKRGYIKLSDFGLSTIGRDKAKSICGTIEYIAPEVLLGGKYSNLVDFWALGCLIYEMMYGFSPFRKRNLNNLRKSIVKGNYCFPDFKKGSKGYGLYSDKLKDFVRRLLVVDEKRRLGAKGFFEIFEHDWVKDVDFEEILDKKIVSPFFVKDFRTEDEEFEDSEDSYENLSIVDFTFIGNDSFN